MTKEYIPNNGIMLKFWLRDTGFTAKWLGQQLGVSTSCVVAWKRGHSVPSPAAAEKIDFLSKGYVKARHWRRVGKTGTSAGAKAIRAALYAKDMSLNAAAKALGIPQTTLCRNVANDHAPSGPRMRQLANFLGITLTEDMFDRSAP